MHLDELTQNSISMGRGPTKSQSVSPVGAGRDDARNLTESLPRWLLNRQDVERLAIYNTDIVLIYGARAWTVKHGVRASKSTPWPCMLS